MLEGLLIGWALKQSMDGILAGNTSMAASAKSEAESLRIELDRLSMVTEALWLILKEKNGYSDEELVARLQEIDMRDGRLDGKPQKAQPKRCPHCGQILMKQIPKCLYCGQEIQWEPFNR